MKRLAISAVLLASVSASASAQELWQGDVFVTAANATCGQIGISENDFFRAVFRPRDVGANDADTRLALFGPRNAYRVIINNGALSGSGQYDGQAIFGTAGFASWTGNFAIATTTPASPTPTTKTVAIRVQLRSFGDVACTMTIAGSLSNRP